MADNIHLLPPVDGDSQSFHFDLHPLTNSEMSTAQFADSESGSSKRPKIDVGSLAPCCMVLIVYVTVQYRIQVALQLIPNSDKAINVKVNYCHLHSSQKDGFVTPATPDERSAHYPYHEDSIMKYRQENTVTDASHSASHILEGT